jgi:hypothetical protein
MPFHKYIAFLSIMSAPITESSSETERPPPKMNALQETPYAGVGGAAPQATVDNIPSSAVRTEFLLPRPITGIIFIRDEGGRFLLERRFYVASREFFLQSLCWNFTTTLQLNFFLQSLCLNFTTTLQLCFFLLLFFGEKRT